MADTRTAAEETKMSVTVERCSSVEEMLDALAPIFHYFGMRPGAQDADRWTRTIGVERMHAAREDGETVGGAGAFPLELTVPGGTVRAAGVTVVGVRPTHRRRGILTSMMRAQLNDIHDNGEPVAYLWASEESIYGRFGYGMASLCGAIDLPKAMNSFARPFKSRAQIRMVDEDAAYEPFSRIYEGVRRNYPGMLARSEDWWRLRRLADPENRRAGGGILNRVLLSLDGEPEAYALYRMHQNLELGVSKGHVNVIEAIGTSLDATREIWRMLLDIDWIAHVKAELLPMDHPLFFLLARPRAMSFRVADGLWVRLVDVQAALAARTIGPGEAVVIEIVDPFCPWNEGRYRIGEGVVARTTASADLALDVNALGSVYLGGFGFAQLARAGRVEELRAGSLARADALFPRDRAPWCPEIF
jgi:predicted acetyltransferase